MTAGAMERAMKSTVDEIRQRFDADVERFSNLETGQSATVDAPLAMALIAQAAAAATPNARYVLDVGCGAGNYTLKLLERLPDLDVTLIDLSQPMLDRATERIRRSTTGQITTIQADKHIPSRRRPGRNRRRRAGCPSDCGAVRRRIIETRLGPARSH
jgi:ubiquinone/menaquinone biosynthesis C-methylase UbiE